MNYRRKYEFTLVLVSPQKLHILSLKGDQTLVYVNRRTRVGELVVSVLTTTSISLLSLFISVDHFLLCGGR